MPHNWGCSETNLHCGLIFYRQSIGIDNHFRSLIVVRYLFAVLILAVSLTVCGQGFVYTLCNEDPGFRVKSGGWTLDKTGSFYHNFKFSCTGPGTGASVAAWTLEGLPTGTYQVDFYVDNSASYTTAAEYIVEDDSGVTTLTKSQRSVTTGWVSLGQFHFTNAGRISQTDRGLASGIKVIADTLRMTYQGTTPPYPTVDVVPPSIGMCIDDMGGDNPTVSTTGPYKLFQTSPMFTYAVMPSQAYGTLTLQTAQAKGIETVLHQPMEYVGQGTGASGTDTVRLYSNLSNAVNLGRFQTNMNAQTPYIVGCNNHQGSLFSELTGGMGMVVDELKARKMFYYDSRTICDSVGADVARAKGLPTTERDLFIDSDTPSVVVDNLSILATRALYAPNTEHCGIGHPNGTGHAGTVSGIGLAMPVLQAMGVSVRPISRMVSYVVEADQVPTGASLTVTGPSSLSSNDMMAEDCVDGNAILLPGGPAAAATARFAPNFLNAGMYRVFVGFAAGTSNCDTAKVTIHGSAGDAARALNQQVEPNRWHYVGTYGFDAGTTGYVQLDNSLCSNSTHVIRADAVRFQYDGPLVITAASDWSLYN